MKNRKSSFYFLPLVVIFCLIALIYLYIVLLDKEAPFGKETLGKRQFNLIQTHLKSEAALLYVDESASFAIQQASYDMAKNGGMLQSIESGEDEVSVNSCGKIDDANVWFSIKKTGAVYKETECFNETMPYSNIEFYFNDELGKYLSSSPYSFFLDNYYFNVKGNLEIAASAISKMKFNIFEDYDEADARELLFLDSLKQLNKVDKVVFDDNGEEVVSGTEAGKIDQSKSVVLVDINKIGSVNIGEGKDIMRVSFSEMCQKGQRCLLKEDAVEKIAKAQSIAKKDYGVSLQLTSTYRDIRMQKALWNGKWARIYPDPKMRRKYVCDPTNGALGCPHLSGNAVDIRISGRPMTQKDWMTLEDIMYKAGWVRYQAEPWHFECCSTKRAVKASEIEKQTGTRPRSLP
ncbi:MAG TPA: hypothetical protein VI564_07365 [Candidatus Nanoarchaeia archaeon]|nr:hypothetical protein [Candidatus Nanoarchaeia archaeon]